jgi:hypothetical protein
MRRFKINFNVRNLLLFGGVGALAAVIILAYLFTVGVLLREDWPIVRSFIEPRIEHPEFTVSWVADTWRPLRSFVSRDFRVSFDVNAESEDDFFRRMSDIERRSLQALASDFPEIIQGGWPSVTFDALADNVSQFIFDTERNESLRERILSGAVRTRQGHPIVALDGAASVMLVEVDINATRGYLVISYERRRTALAISHRAFEGVWSNVAEHSHTNYAIAAIPANDFAFNARTGYGIVAGGFYDNNVIRYTKSGNHALYMGFNRRGEFTAGASARFGNVDFTEGQGLLLERGRVPEKIVVPAVEQAAILAALAEFLHSEGIDLTADGFDSVQYIRAFIASFHDYWTQARFAWTIRENALNGSLFDVEIIHEMAAVVATIKADEIEEYMEYLVSREIYEVVVGDANEDDEIEIFIVIEEIEEDIFELFDTNDVLYALVGHPHAGAVGIAELVHLVVICNIFGADTYEEIVIPFRIAYNALGQRHMDGATFLFGIGGARIPYLQEVPGTGATLEELQELFELYGATYAAAVTSGNRVGLAWRGTNLLRVIDTDVQGGRSYGAYYLRR